jgi:phospholipase/lecithinase/hemolysin
MIRRAAFVALLALATHSAFAAPQYDHLYAFGDSYSDNGAGQAFTEDLVGQKVKDASVLPGPLYWQGRWSNGPTAVEGLAKALNVPLTDYAIGGAKSGDGNYYAWMEPARNTGVFGQIADHLQAAPEHKADPEALYFIFVSANDFFEWGDMNHEESVEDLAHMSLGNIQSAARTLVGAGARHVLVVGTTDLARVPAVVAGKQVKQATVYQQILAQQLPLVLAELAKTQSVDVRYFDHLAFSNRLRADAASAGLTDINSPCQATYPKVLPVCTNPDAHYYWDEWHPTQKVHQLAGAAMLETLKANR